MKNHIINKECRGEEESARRRAPTKTSPTTKTSSPLSVITLQYHNKAFVIKRGKVGLYTKELLKDTRELLYPYTALKLKESKKNSLKDFVSAAGQFGVSHMLVFSQTDKAVYLRLIKNPRGPTVTFKIADYSLARDVVKYQQLHRRYSKIFSREL